MEIGPVQEARTWDNICTASTLFQTFPPAHQADISQAIQKATEVVTTLATEVGQIAAARDYTEEGKRARIADVLAKDTPALAALEKAVEAEAAACKAGRERLERGWMVREGSAYVERRPVAPSGDDLLRAPEIRQLLYARRASAIAAGQSESIATREIAQLYLTAVQADNDPDLIRAFETAPRLVPLLDQRAESDAKMIRLSRYPMEVIAALEHNEAALKIKQDKIENTKRILAAMRG